MGDSMKIIIKYTNGRELTLRVEDFGFYQDIEGMIHIGYLNKSNVGMNPRCDIPLDPKYIDEVIIKEFNT